MVDGALFARIEAWATERKVAWWPAFLSGKALPEIMADSLEVVRFVAFLQTEFGVAITPADYFSGAFRGPEALVEFLVKKGTKGP